MIATVVYSIFAGWQLYEIHTGATDTHNLAVAAGEQADEGKKLAQNAAGTLKTTQEALQLDQRAWLGMRESYILPADPTGKIRVRIQIVNTGKTPAIEVTSSVTAFVRPIPILRKPPPDAPRHTVFRNLAPIPPQGTTTINLELKVSDFSGDYPDIKTGTKIIYEIGEIGYSDIFGDRHLTRFFLYQNAPTDQLLSTCEGGNSMN